MKEKEQIIEAAKMLIDAAKKQGKNDLRMMGFATKVERALMQHLNASINKSTISAVDNFLSVDVPQKKEKAATKAKETPKDIAKKEDIDKSNKIIDNISKMTIPELVSNFKLIQMKVVVQAINEAESVRIEISESVETMAEQIFKHFQSKK